MSTATPNLNNRPTHPPRSGPLCPPCQRDTARRSTSSVSFDDEQLHPHAPAAYARVDTCIAVGDEQFTSMTQHWCGIASPSSVSSHNRRDSAGITTSRVTASNSQERSSLKFERFEECMHVGPLPVSLEDGCREGSLADPLLPQERATCVVNPLTVHLFTAARGNNSAAAALPPPHLPSGPSGTDRSCAASSGSRLVIIDHKLVPIGGSTQTTASEDLYRLLSSSQCASATEAGTATIPSCESAANVGQVAHVVFQFPPDDGAVGALGNTLEAIPSFLQSQQQRGSRTHSNSTRDSTATVSAARDPPLEASIAPTSWAASHSSADEGQWPVHPHTDVGGDDVWSCRNRPNDKSCREAMAAVENTGEHGADALPVMFLYEAAGVSPW